MRVVFLFLLLACSFRLYGQGDYEQVQKALETWNVLPPEQCYQNLLHQGLNAQRAGDLNQALSFFRQAEQCEDVSANPVYRKQLDVLIAQCETPVKRRNLVFGEINKDKGPQRRGRYQPSRAFLRYDEPECYELTIREAQRAYNGGYWDDAASLFRAAKNCADADQNKRRDMNERIEDCRIAAENELLNQKIAAEHQARQAIAANRADDARSLLRKMDRTLAYRLADFANNYIAPLGENNSDCLQAMFDSWYLGAPTAREELSAYRVPLCYELEDNLGANPFLRFGGERSQAKMFAFSPDRKLVYSWKAANLSPIALSTADLQDRPDVGFDVSPDGATVLFDLGQAYILRRGRYEYYSVFLSSEDGLYHFDPTGRYFSYYDRYRRSISTLDLDEIFAKRKELQQQQREAIKPRVNGLGDNLSAFEFHQQSLWLCYSDTLKILHKEQSSQPWRVKASVKLEGLSPAVSRNQNFRVVLMPGRNAVLVSDGFFIYTYQLPENPSGNFALQALYMEEAELITVSRDRQLMAMARYNPSNDRLLIIQDPLQTSDRMPIMALLPGNEFFAANGSDFSTDNTWFAACNTDGKVNLWLLDEKSNFRTYRAGESAYMDISPDGRWMLNCERNQIKVSSVAEPDNILYATDISPNGSPTLVAGNEWVVFRHSADSLSVWNWRMNRLLHFRAGSGDFFDFVCSLDEPGNRIACQDNDSIFVYSLESGRLLHVNAFEGFTHSMAFVPGTDLLLAVQYVATESRSTTQVIPRMWDMSHPGADDRVIRFHGSTLDMMCVSPLGEYVAFSDVESARIYAVDNPFDEAIRMRPLSDKRIAQMAFHPDAQTLVVAYHDGEVVFWDIQTGKDQYRLLPPVGYQDLQPSHLRVTSDGEWLHMALEGSWIVTRNLNPAWIGKVIQDRYRRLVAFRPEQIRDMELDKALEYEGNFERLAASGDMPLIRSFFDFYQLQAFSNNNIYRVSDYCTKAFRLYAQLEAEARENLKPTMLTMYADFNRKLLLRTKYREAGAVIDSMRTNFGESPALQVAEAHTHLMLGDLTAAAGLYTDWLLSTMREGSSSALVLDSLKSRFLEMQEYGLLNGAQSGCVCALFGEVLDLGKLCVGNTAQAEAYLSPKDMLRWKIFSNLYQSEQLFNHREKVRLLTGAFDKSRKLLEDSPEDARILGLDVLLALGQTYRDWSVFEQGSKKSFAHLDSAISLLGSQLDVYDRDQRLVLELASACTEMGNLYYQTDKVEQAMAWYDKGLELLNAVNAASEEQRKRIDNDYRGQIVTQMGLSMLLLGKPDEADDQFTWANDLLDAGLNSFYKGHVALLRGDTDSAWLEYGGISDEEQAAMVLTFIDRMADRNPGSRSFLLEQRSVLETALPRVRKTFSPPVMHYHIAANKTTYAGNRKNWKEAALWSDSTLTLAEALLNNPRQQLFWRDYWLDAHLNQAFYLLFVSAQDSSALSKAIRYSLDAERYILTVYAQYRYKRYLKTNLAHAYWLRNQTGDRAAAIEAYRFFLDPPPDPWAFNSLRFDPWETLMKDFRDLYQAGVRFPDIEDLIRQIKPDEVTITPDEWRDLGISKTMDR